MTKELNPDPIFMYGSCSTGGAKDDSDIDVAVIFNGARCIRPFGE
ncbi:MAG: nucleotidyltransferase domain-containing protein [Synergistaceae bacterium]|nr:nucleotidyltransferase domain-containing protein [Synergistaceae bacterium]